VVISGTGSISYGVNQRGLAARAGGWGPTLADEGSGYWIGRRALAAVMREADGRGPKTALTQLVLAHFQLPKADALVAEIYQQLQQRPVVASLGTLVDRAREEGDLVATDIMSQAVHELAISASSVISQLDMRGEAFPILLAGGMLKESPWLSSEMGRLMAEVAPRARVEALTHEPVFGAVRLAIAEAGGGVRVPQYIDAFQ